MNLSDIAPLALRVGHIKEQLLTPCKCGRLNCTLGEHVWHATRAMRSPGVRAANTDPGGGNRWETDADGDVWAIPNDPTGESAVGTESELDEWVDALKRLNQAADHFAVVFGQLRPDRRLHVASSGVSEWCLHHLRTIGKCEPTYRKSKAHGELCRICYDFQLAHDEKLPPVDLLEHKHQGGKWTDQMIAASLKAAKPVKRKKGKRKAS